MTKEQFIEVFQRNLNVGGQKRDEIVKEMRSHLQEESAERLGDPILLARQSNRVHLGLFDSFRSLAIVAAVTTVVFDTMLLFVTYRYGIGAASRSNWPIFNLLLQIAPYVSPVVFLSGAHVISRMRNRWVYVAGLAAIFTIGYTLQHELMQVLGYEQFFPASGSASLWTVHIQPATDFFITFAIIGYAVMVVTAGRQLIISRHPVIDISLAFILEGAGAYYLLPMIWNAITSFHYTEAMYYWSVPVFDHLKLICVGIGLLGAGIEWLRLRAIQQHRIPSR